MAHSGGQRRICERQDAPHRRKSAPAMPTKTTDLSDEERLIIARHRVQHMNGMKNSPDLNVQKKTSQPKKKVSFITPAEELALSPLAEEDEY